MLQVLLNPVSDFAEGLAIMVVVHVGQFHHVLEGHVPPKIREGISFLPERIALTKSLNVTEYTEATIPVVMSELITSLLVFTAPKGNNPFGFDLLIHHCSPSKSQSIVGTMVVSNIRLFHKG
jgi:hypothetical protein